MSVVSPGAFYGPSSSADCSRHASTLPERLRAAEMRAHTLGRTRHGVNKPAMRLAQTGVYRVFK